MPSEKAFETNLNEKGPRECQSPQLSFPFLTSQASYHPLYRAIFQALMVISAPAFYYSSSWETFLLLLQNLHHLIISFGYKLFQNELFLTKTRNTRFKKYVFSSNICWQPMLGFKDGTHL